jgi:ferredoxin
MQKALDRALAASRVRLLSARVGGAEIEGRRILALEGEDEAGPVKIRAERFVLATGRFTGGGLTGRGAVREAIFGLPVFHRARPVGDRAVFSLLRPGYFTRQPLFDAGIRAGATCAAGRRRRARFREPAGRRDDPRRLRSGAGRDGARGGSAHRVRRGRNRGVGLTRGQSTGGRGSEPQEARHLRVHGPLLLRPSHRAPPPLAPQARGRRARQVPAQLPGGSHPSAHAGGARDLSRIRGLRVLRTVHLRVRAHTPGGAHCGRRAARPEGPGRLLRPVDPEFWAARDVVRQCRSCALCEEVCPTTRRSGAWCSSWRTRWRRKGSI